MFFRIALTLTALALAISPQTQAQEKKFTASPGLQLYSLRSSFKLKGVPRTLDAVKSFGITNVEPSNGRLINGKPRDNSPSGTPMRCRLRQTNGA